MGTHFALLIVCQGHPRLKALIKAMSGLLYPTAVQLSFDNYMHYRPSTTVLTAVVFWFVWVFLNVISVSNFVRSEYHDPAYETIT